ncbi:hypothetical protein AX14_010890 [Amanita brunnescens Koide BX004]|nr:hypothetical protein AX14_010890 [Amanita brunnescens Koide BX004]
MPIERFLKQRESEDHSDSFVVSSLDLPLPPPTAADFPELPRAVPTPKMTKAEKAMAEKINTLLLSDVKGKRSSEPTSKPASPIEKTVAKPAQALSNAKGKRAPEPTSKPVSPIKKTVTKPAQAPAPSKPAATPGILLITGNMRSDAAEPLPQPSGSSTPIMAMATFHAEHVVSCSHDTGSAASCTLPLLRNACDAPSAFTGRVT